MSTSRLYRGRVMHQRLRPLRHRLRYRVFSLLLDLDELPALHARLRLFSLDRFNLFSIHQSDHGAGAPGGLRAHVERQLAGAGLAAGGTIRMLTMPRLLGHVFNPLTVYFCHAPAGPLQAILYEVNSTFGERHSYLLPVPPGPPDGLVRQACAKRLHVSPFLPMELHYRFRVRPPGDGSEPLAVGVDAHDAQGPLLVARFDARARPLTDGALLAAWLAHPLLTLKVVAAIHWEALRLWLKGAPLHRQPAPPSEAVSLPDRPARP